MRRLCTFLLLLQMALPAAAQVGPARKVGLSFRAQGNLIQTHTAHTLDFLLPHQKVQVESPKSHQVMIFRAFSLVGVLNAVFGRQLEPGEVLRITSKDGYRITIPQSMIEQHQAFLAYKTGDNKPLPARLAPFYLVWKDAPASNAHSKWGRFWPRQIVSIELASIQKPEGRKMDLSRLARL
jgi:hypothetical protein